MTAEWYYVDGTPYCAECVECGGPAIAAEDATRGPAPSGGRCACCGDVPLITAEMESDVAIYAEGTPYTKADILRAYRSYLENSQDSLGLQQFCEIELGIAIDGGAA